MLGEGCKSAEAKCSVPILQNLYLFKLRQDKMEISVIFYYSHSVTFFLITQRYNFLGLLLSEFTIIFISGLSSESPSVTGGSEALGMLWERESPKALMRGRGIKESFVDELTLKEFPSKVPCPSSYHGKCLP